MPPHRLAVKDAGDGAREVALPNRAGGDDVHRALERRVEHVEVRGGNVVDVDPR